MVGIIWPTPFLYTGLPVPLSGMSPPVGDDDDDFLMIVKYCRVSLNAERSRATAAARAVEETNAEVHTLQARLQRLADDNHALAQEKMMVRHLRTIFFHIVYGLTHTRLNIVLFFSYNLNSVLRARLRRREFKWRCTFNGCPRYVMKLIMPLFR